MTAVAPEWKVSDIADHPFFRVVAFYVFLFASAAVLVLLIPGALCIIHAEAPATALLPGSHGTGAAVQALVCPILTPMGALGSVVAALVSLAGACLLMVPVTWVYVQTRRKKGFQQSVVQTLIILPLVVAGVVLLVQNSVALAFSLGGIVGAVSFRNSLSDTKDTIYIFLAIVVGLAAGVHAMLIAATISVSFNIVAAIMWWLDFGRFGSTLEGAPAERRLRRAKALADRTHGFISMIDRELLKSMTPEQLDVLAGRARVRQHAAAAAAELEEGAKLRRDWTLHLEVAGSAAESRTMVQSSLEELTKRWQFAGESAGNAGSAVVQYQIRLKKRTDPADFLARFRAAAGTRVRTASLVE
jgi:hypothetical protein